MVRTSNWPPLVAISVVTRWRRTFSSSVTHFTVTSGFFAVNSLDSPCMRIMSPLFTVAIVRVVCAIEGAATNSVAAPRTAPRTCFTLTSLNGVEHLPTPCKYVHTEFAACQGSDQLSRRRACAVGHAATTFLRPAHDIGTGRPRGCWWWNRRLLFQDGACRRLVGDQPVDQTALQRRLDRRHLGSADGGSDG